MHSSDVRILVVDDDVLMLDFLSTTLNRRGFQVDPTDNGDAALEKIRSTQYSLVLTDLKMLGTSGIEILDAVKENWPGTEVVIITGYATVENAVEAMKKGARDYISKPCSAAEIELVVDRTLEYQDLKAENQYLQSELRHRDGLENVIGTSPSMNSSLDY